METRLSFSPLQILYYFIHPFTTPRPRWKLTTVFRAALLFRPWSALMEAGGAQSYQFRELPHHSVFIWTSITLLLCLCPHFWCIVHLNEIVIYRMQLFCHLRRNLHVITEVGLSNAYACKGDCTNSRRCEMCGWLHIPLDISRALEFSVFIFAREISSVHGACANSVYCLKDTF